MPYVIVAAVLSIVVISAVDSGQSSRATFAFNVFWPAPTSYAPGVIPPNIFLRINFTGPGVGNYSYSITYDSGSGSIQASQGNVLVSHVSPFTAYLYIPLSRGTTTSVTAVVYEGSPSEHKILYTKTLEL
jgi:hypothetical protein